MKMIKFEYKVLSVNSEVLVHLKNIESPDSYQIIHMHLLTDIYMYTY